MLHDLAADTALQGRPRTGNHDGEPLPFDGIAPVDDHLAVLRVMFLTRLGRSGQKTLKERKAAELDDTGVGVEPGVFS